MIATFNRPGGPYPGNRGRHLEDDKFNYRINNEIRATHVRLVGDSVEQQIVPIQEAQKMAEDQGLDLVEIHSQGDPPVCKIIDYTKFIYEQKKKQKELKSKSAKSVIKEVRFGPNTDDHDFEFKLKNARKFLEEGSKVKAYVHFKGRTIVHKDRGELLLLKFVQELEDVGKIEKLPTLEGKRMIVMLNPKGK